jgi:hypothetical protein
MYNIFFKQEFRIEKGRKCVLLHAKQNKVGKIERLAAKF